MTGNRRDLFWEHRRAFAAILATALGLSLLLSGSVNAAPSGPAAFWSFENGTGTTVSDSSANGLDGSLVGGAWTGSGAIGGAIDFTGTAHERITVSDPANDLDIGLDEELSLSVWFQSSGTPAVSDFWTLARRRNTGGAPEGYAMFLSGGGPPTITFDLWYGASSSGITIGSPDLTDGGWHHAVGVIDATGMELWLDGVLVGSAPKTSWTSSTAEPFVIGTNADADDSMFDFEGSLDEVAVYSRALTSAEIADLFDDRATAPLVVNSTALDGDASPGNGSCDTGGTNSEGATECTLRAAMEEANAGSHSEIEFSIPTSDPGYNGTWWTVSPTIAGGLLPSITGITRIDATTQPGYTSTPLIALDGADRALEAGIEDGLTAQTATTISGLSIANWSGDGVVVTADDVTLDRSWIGVLPDSAAAGNDATGVDAFGGASRLTVSNSVVSASSFNGIQAAGADLVVVGNLIGVGPDGVTPMGNGRNGIRLYSNAVDAIIGRPGEGNVIGDNGVVGVELDGDPVSATIQSNHIGTDATATVDLGHGESAVLFQETSVDSTVGFSGLAADPAEANVMMFNGGPTPYASVNVRDSVTGMVSIRGNSITRNDGLGIDLGEGSAVSPNDVNDADGGANDTINFPVITAITPSTPGMLTVDFLFDSGVGTYHYDFYSSPAGPDASGFGEGGVWLDVLVAGKSSTGSEAFSHDIPGNVGDVITMTATQSNVTFRTSEFSQFGVAASTTATVNSTGTASDQTPGDGLCNTGSVNSEGLMECTLSAAIQEANAAGAVDTVEFDIPTSDGGYDGINGWWTINDNPTTITTPLTIDGTTQAGTTVNTAAAPAPLNSQPTILIDGTGFSGDLLNFASGADNSTVMGLAIGGITTNSGDSAIQFGAVSNMTVVGNHIGVMPDGLTPIPSSEGLAFYLTASNGQVGGTTAADRNLFATNDTDLAMGFDAGLIVIEGNEFGYDVNGDVLSTFSTSAAIDLRSNNQATIGGTTVAQGNRIAGSTGGVLVSGTSRATVLGNEMTGLNRPSIDLGANDGTPNDPGDGDTGPNDLLNTPDNVAATEAAGTISVDFDLDVPAGDYRVEFFTNPGQAHPMTLPWTGSFASAVTVTHLGAGSQAFSHTFAGTAGSVVTATATEDLGGGSYGVTSEPGDSAIAFGSTAVVNSSGDSADSTPGDGLCDTGALNSEGATECTLRAAIAEANANASLSDITFDIPTSDAGHDAPNNLWTISPTTGLGALSNDITIDGSTQPGWVDDPVIVLSGDVGPAGHTGLTITGDGATVRSLSIVSFTNNGIAVLGDDTLLAANWIGVDPTGTIGSNANGVLLSGANDTIIGGSTADANVIAGNRSNGVMAQAASDGTIIRDNSIGTDSSGAIDLGNDGDGVLVNTTGTTRLQNNDIAFNDGDGLATAAASTGDVYIVFNTFRSNGGLGIDLDDDGVTPNDVNDSDTGVNGLLNFPVITGFNEVGANTEITYELDAPAGGYVVIFGRNPSGTDPSGNGEFEDGFGNANIIHPGGGTVSFTTTGYSSLNPGDTVTAHVYGQSVNIGSELSAPLVYAQKVGLVNSTSDVADLSPGDGLCDTGALNSEGDPECTLRAAIAEANASADMTTIEFDIPTSDAGHDAINGWWTIQQLTDFPDITDSVTIDGTTQAGSTVNTTAAGATMDSRLRVMIDGSATAGLEGLRFVAGSDGSALRGLSITGHTKTGGSGVEIESSNVVIAGNHFGMAPDGVTIANTDEAISIFGSANDISVGGTAPADRNMFGGSNGWTIAIGASATDVRVEGNDFGYDATGSTQANTSAGGVRLSNNSQATVGGVAPAQTNRFVGYATAISVRDNAQATALGNSILTGTGVGIDLVGDGATANDPGDADSGVNDLLNHPDITNVTHAAGSVTVTWNLDVPAGDHRIEWFRNPSGTESGALRQGFSLAHTQTVTSTGVAQTGLTTTFVADVDDDISATTTIDTGGGTFTATSEFSAAMETNAAPTVVDPADQTDAENDSISLTIGATDPDSDALAWVASGLPPGLTIGAGSGEISGTLTFTSSGVYSVTATATDPDGESDSTTFNWTVNNTNRVPLVTDPGDQNDAENDIISLTIAGSDPDGTPLTWGATGLPNGLSIAPGTGEVSGTLSYTSSGTSPVTVTATDGTDTTQVQFDWIVANTNRDPVVTDPPTQTNAEGNTVSFTVGGTDPDGQSLFWTATSLPPTLTINSATGEISGTLTFTSAGTYSVTVTARDPENATDSTTFTWQVNNTNLGVTVNSPGDQTNAETDVVSLFINGSDGDNDPLIWTETGLPDGLSIVAGTGEIAGTVSYDAAGGHTVTVTATDPGGASDSTTFNWTIDNTNRAPVVTNPGPQADAENDTISRFVVANDPDGDTLTWTATGLPNGLVIDSATGEVTGVPTYESEGTQTVSVTVADAESGTIASFDWTITNTNRAPIVGGQPDIVSAEDDVILLTNSASDPDGQTVTWAASGLPDGLTIDAANGDITGTISFDAAGPHTVVVTATDPEAASADTTFQWTVDNTNRAPIVTNPPDQTNAEGNVVSFSVGGTDPDGQTIAWSSTGLPTGLTIDPATGLISGTIPFTAAGTWTPSVTATDLEAAATSSSFIWTVTNTNLGVIVNSPGDQQDAEFATVSLFINGSDGDNEPLTWSATGLPDGLSIDTATGEISGTLSGTAAGVSTVQVTASEPSGLSDSTTFEWTVDQVNQAPTLTNPGPQSGTDGTATSLNLTASDPDGDALSWSAIALPPGLTINGTTGRISGTPNTTGSFTVRVTVSDGIDESTRAFVWTITAAAITPPATTTTTAQPAPTTTAAVAPQTTAPPAPTTTRPTQPTSFPSTTVPIEVPDGLAFRPVEARDDTIVIRSQELEILAVLSNDFLNPGTQIVALDQPEAGEVRLLNDGSIVFDPPPGFAGELTFGYTIEDESGTTSSAIVRLVIAVALEQTVGSATVPVSEGLDDVVGAFFTRIGSLIGGVLSIKLSRLDSSMLFVAAIVFLVLRAFALRRRESLVRINGVSKGEGIPISDDAGDVFTFRHDATMWIRGRSGRRSNGDRQVKVESPNGDGWVDADTITDTGY